METTNTFYDFPKDFWWGAAISATQVEGAANVDGRTPSVYDDFFKNDPWRFQDMEHGPDKAVEFYYRYKEDIALAKKIGLNTFRFTISWSRLLPDGKSGVINEKAIKFYNDIINELLENNIEPFIALMCFDPPLYLKHGDKLWDRREIVEEFAFYGKTCFELFGDRVKKWFTAVEGAVDIECGYLKYYHPPFVIDYKRAFQASFNFLLGSARCIEEYKKLNLGGKIGTINAVYTAYAYGSQEEDIKAAKLANLTRNKYYLDTFIKGKIPDEIWSFWDEHGLTPQYTKEDLQIIRDNTIQIMGVNYYDPMRVRAPRFEANSNSPVLPDHFYETCHADGGRTAGGREIYEKGLYDALKLLKYEYGNIECYVSENGIRMDNEERFKNQEGIIEDDYRIDFIKNHLIMIQKAFKEGCNVKGYHPWSLMDNWSWQRGMFFRYGLIRVDKESMKRTIKKSGYWYSEVIKGNGFNK